MYAFSTWHCPLSHMLFRKYAQIKPCVSEKSHQRGLNALHALCSLETAKKTEKVSKGCRVWCSFYDPTSLSWISLLLIKPSAACSLVPRVLSKPLPGLLSWVFQAKAVTPSALKTCMLKRLECSVAVFQLSELSEGTSTARGHISRHWVVTIAKSRVDNSLSIQ